jgi:hypothetical protein
VIIKGEREAREEKVKIWWVEKEERRGEGRAHLPGRLEKRRHGRHGMNGFGFGAVGTGIINAPSLPTIYNLLLLYYCYIIVILLLYYC